MSLSVQKGLRRTPNDPDMVLKGFTKFTGLPGFKNGKNRHLKIFDILLNIYLLFTAFPSPLNCVEPGELCIADYCQPVPCTATEQCVTDKYFRIIHLLY